MQGRPPGPAAVIPKRAVQAVHLQVGLETVATTPASLPKSISAEASLVGS